MTTPSSAQSGGLRQCPSPIVRRPLARSAHAELVVIVHRIGIVAQRSQHVAQEFLLGDRKFGRAGYQVVKALFSLRFPNSVNADPQCLGFKVARMSRAKFGFVFIVHESDDGSGQRNFRGAL
ncbi:hypothetical protein LMG27174_05737 [Paraburkholderia rhynchosiae]|uniref:Uncharacterized protein n=1 Tax=Paraburkholderia rhynchosiae TaxID=487049 RepID=A0A6J5CB82_9BURK|nr:hypothetical protein LMG27174_05737 [Paraburkholderia rhynchosiae]